METVRDERKFEEYGLGGSIVGVVAGLIALVLAIIGLSGVHPVGLVAISVMVVGIALLVESGVMGAEYRTLTGYIGESRSTRMELGGGLGVEAVAGLAALILGLLALIGIRPDVLVACGTILLGFGVIFGSRVHDRVRTMRINPAAEGEEMDRVTRDLLASATAAQVLVGLGAVILGVLALVGFAPITLNLVAVLAIGASILISGAMLGSHFYFLFRRA